jgi:hypothetical protein
VRSYTGAGILRGPPERGYGAGLRLEVVASEIRCRLAGNPGGGSERILRQVRHTVRAAVLR